MRILVSTLSRAVVGGAETYLQRFLPHLRARGHQVRSYMSLRASQEGLVDELVSEQAATPKVAHDDWYAQLPVDEESRMPWHEQLKPFLGNLGGKWVLEIGCGRGGFAAWLAERPGTLLPADVMAGDFSPTEVRRAEDFGRARGLTNVSYRVGDLMGLDWPEGSFDMAISCETIEHTPDPKRALSELARVLRPGGTLSLTCPNYLSLSGLHRIYQELTGRPFMEEGQPINHFLLLPRVRRWVECTGLRVERVQGMGHYLPFPGRPPLRIPQLERLPFSYPVALHPLIVARKAEGRPG